MAAGRPCRSLRLWEAAPAPTGCLTPPRDAVGLEGSAYAPAGRRTPLPAAARGHAPPQAWEAARLPLLAVARPCRSRIWWRRAPSAPRRRSSGGSHAGRPGRRRGCTASRDGGGRPGRRQGPAGPHRAARRRRGPEWRRERGRAAGGDRSGGGNDGRGGRRSGGWKSGRRLDWRREGRQQPEHGGLPRRGSSGRWRRSGRRGGRRRIWRSSSGEATPLSVVGWDLGAEEGGPKR